MLNGKLYTLNTKEMKKFNFLPILLISALFLTLESCGPVVFSSRLGTPPPPWFYPNRVENVRYMYFPDYQFYYDLSLRNYIYLDNGTWLTVNVLPARFKGYDLKRSRKIRINDYYGDDIRKYHSETTTRRKNINTRRSY